jgi:hypothetical protein
VSASLQAFINANSGRRIALAVNGVYKISRVELRVHDLTLDFRGSRLAASLLTIDRGHVTLIDARNVVLNDPNVTGTGYTWVDALQGQHAIDILGGANIVVNRLRSRDVKGDGVYVGYGWGASQPATGVVINQPDIERSARNGIAVVAGETTINGGRLVRSGLHALDLEPNDSLGASTTRVTIKGTDLRLADDLPGTGGPDGLGYSIGGGWGYTATRKPSLVVEAVTSDELSIAVSALNLIRVVNNRSDTPAIFEWWNSSNVTFSGNTNLTPLAT